MILAKILFMGICGVACSALIWSTTSAQTPQADSSASDPASSKQEGAAKTQAPAEPKISPSTGSSPKSSTVQTKTTSKKVRHKKKPASACAITSERTSSTTSSGAPDPSSGGTVEGQSPANQDSAKCPPPKVIVHQGGTAEPAIQLAGGPAGNEANQTSQARTTATPMLDATEANLKKLEGRQLSDAQKDMVTQVRQFMEQSKTAVAAGDVERARTLAWKAQTLSEDLVKPEK